MEIYRADEGIGPYIKQLSKVTDYVCDEILFFEMGAVHMDRRERDQAERASFINTATVLCFLVVVGILSVVLPKPRYSEQEKRDLASMPQFSSQMLLSGQYSRDLSAFYADSFPGRDRFVASAGILQEAAGIAYDGLTLHQGSGDTTVPEESSEPVVPDASVEPEQGPESSSAVQLPTAPGVEGEEDIAPERAGPIIVYNGKGYQIFGGTEAAGIQYAEAINAYQRTLGDKVQVYNLVVPSAIAFGLPEKHQNMTMPEHPRIANVYDHLDDGVIAVDVYDSFEAHKNEYIYFGTDHHWTIYGAYLAYSDFIQAAGMEPVPIDQMEKRTLGYDFFGTYYSQTQDSKLRRSPDTVDYFMIGTPHTALYYYRGSPYYGRQMPLLAEYAQGVNGYSVFLHGDFPLIKITTDIKNGRRIAVVKESFGNAFSPFLVNHYEEVYIVDERYLEVGLVQLMEENDINELLIINNIFAAHTGYHINRLGTIMYQTYVPPVVSAPPTVPEEAGEEGQPTEGEGDSAGEGIPGEESEPEPEELMYVPSPEEED